MKRAIRDEALRLGFAACGFARAGAVSEEATRCTDHWVGQGYHAGMHYMERNRPMRLDPTLLMPGCRTLIVVALNYYPQRLLPEEGYQIAYYAYGKDYHRVVKDKLHQLLAYIRTLDPTTKGRVFCDTAPLLERYWAMQAGLGIIGRNRTLIIPGKGSYFFLGILAIDRELPHDTPMKGDCGNCRRCLEHCPTGALTTEGIDCRRCLSYLTIEHRGPLLEEAARQLGRRIYGCDACQQVCPHNCHAQPTAEPAFRIPDEIVALTPEEWQGLTQQRYTHLFGGSAIERAGYEGLMRNIRATKGSSAASPETE